MSVKSEALDNQERGLDISTREGADPRNPRKRDDQGAADLKVLRERIAKARALERAGILRHDRNPHCGDCFSRGFAAAIALIEGADAP